MKIASADEASGPVTETTVAVATRRIKTITDRVPVEEDSPAGVQPAADNEPAEKVIAVEAVPAEPEAPKRVVEAVVAEPAAVEEASAPEPATAPKPAAKKKPVQPKEVALSGWTVQISSQKDEQVAWTVWKKLKAKHKILADQNAIVMKADLGDRGIVYRLRLAGFEDQGSARDLCGKLKSRGVSCYVSKISS